MNFFDDEPSMFHSSLECSKSVRIIQDNSHLHNISAFAFVASIVLGFSYNNLIYGVHNLYVSNWKRRRERLHFVDL